MAKETVHGGRHGESGSLCERNPPHIVGVGTSSQPASHDRGMEVDDCEVVNGVDDLAHPCDLSHLDIETGLLEYFSASRLPPRFAPFETPSRHSPQTHSGLDSSLNEQDLPVDHDHNANRGHGRRIGRRHDRRSTVDGRGITALGS